MHKHHFNFPDDKPENYNPDGKTITGVCRCGAKQKSYGLRWVIPLEEAFWREVPYGEPLLEETFWKKVPYGEPLF